MPQMMSPTTGSGLAAGAVGEGAFPGSSPEFGARRLLFPLAGFAAGTGSFVLFDLLLASLATDEDIAYWATTRALAVTLSSIVPLGIGQSFIRGDTLIWDIRLPLFAQVCLLSLSGLAAALFSSPAFAPILCVSIAIVGYLTLIAGEARAQIMLNKSIAALHGWKLLTVSIVALGLPFLNQFELLVNLGLLGGPLIVACVIRPLPPTRRPAHANVLSYRTLRSFGLRFSALAGVAAAFLYCDQLLLAAIASPRQQAHYFFHVAAFLPFGQLVSGFLANLAAPWIRLHKHDLALMSRVSLHTRAIATALALCACNILSGYLLLSLIAPQYTISWSLVYLLQLCAALRFLYLPYSAIASVLGEMGSLSRLLAGSLAAVVLVPLLATGLNLSGLPINVELAVAGSLAAGLAVRSGLAFWTARIVLATSSMAYHATAGDE